MRMQVVLPCALTWVCVVIAVNQLHLMGHLVLVHISRVEHLVAVATFNFLRFGVYELRRHQLFALPSIRVDLADEDERLEIVPSRQTWELGLSESRYPLN